MLNNLPARTARVSESAQVWVEVFSGTTGSLEIPKYSTVRVRATGATIVSFDSVLSATMSTGEIMYFNAGEGNTSDSKQTVTLTIAVAGAYVQIGKLIDSYEFILPHP